MATSSGAGGVVAVAPGSTTITATFATLQGSAQVRVAYVPPDPIPSVIDQTTSFDFSSAYAFLYGGSNPVQTGVSPGTIVGTRAAVIHGIVKKADGTGLPGVTVSVSNHPEYGQTQSRSNGQFDLVVNGGGTVVLHYERFTYVLAERSVSVAWHRHAQADDVILLPLDAATAVNLGSTTVTVVRGSRQTDATGSRQATLMFKPGTSANLMFPDGHTQPISNLKVRATEASVGVNPSVMPAALPATSGYTYCVELSADEASDAGAASVQFSTSVPIYLENFVGFTVGTDIPVGYYDRQRGAWIPARNGRVVKIVSVTSSRADLDITGDGVADDATAIGVDDQERQKLASLYSVGQELWRVAVDHFTPWDFNYSVLPGANGLPVSASAPNQPRPDVSSPVDCGCTRPNASVVDIHNQALQESFAIVGTPFTLEYDSTRLGTAPYSMTVPLTGSTLPQSLKRVELQISVAGQVSKWQYAPAPNLAQAFTWDGKDAFGRTVPGVQDAVVSISYIYDSVYAGPPAVLESVLAFAISSGRPLQVNGRSEIPLTQTFVEKLGHFDIRNVGFGGWTLDVQKLYDSEGGVFIGENGTTTHSDPNGTRELTLTTVAGNGACCDTGDGGQATAAALNFSYSVAVANDGTIYLVDGYVIRKVAPNGVITKVAGTGNSGFAVDGSIAASSAINPCDVAVGPDSLLYFNDCGNNRIRRIEANGTLRTVAGSGGSGGSQPQGDGGPATSAPISPAGFTIAPDGNIFIADYATIRRVDGAGYISTVAGKPSGGTLTGTAFQVHLDPFDLAIGPDGSVYEVDFGTNSKSIRRLHPDGNVELILSEGSPELADGPISGGGGVADISAFTVAPDGTILIAENANPGFRVRAIRDGVISTIGGTGSGTSSAIPEGSFARAVALSPQDVEFGPDGSLYIIEWNTNTIRKTRPLFPVMAARSIAVPSADGNLLYSFTGGRHMQTIDATTDVTLYTLGYDSGGRLTSITDADGNVTTIERDSSENPTAIVAPGGQRTTLAVTGGFLTSISNPAGEGFQLTYDADGLMQTLTDRRSGVHRYTFTNGKLTRDEDPAGGVISLSRSGNRNDFTVTEQTAEGRMSTYRIQTSVSGAVTLTNTNSAGLVTTQTIPGNQTTSISSPDGTQSQINESADQRFGMQAPVTSSTAVTVPSNNHFTITRTRSVSLTNPTDPLSVSSITETLKLGSDTWTSVYTASTRTNRLTSPASRAFTTTLDAKDHLVSSQFANLTSTTYSYDTLGLLHTATQGARTTTLGYDAKNRLTSIQDPLQRTVTFDYDNADRVTKETLPDTRQILFGYDAAGNLTSVTPPGRPAHAFTFTPVDLEATYTPPSSTATTYTYNHDRQITNVSRPGGTSIGVGYDSAGRVHTVAIGRGTSTLTYQSTTGNLDSITAPDGGIVRNFFDGFLLTGQQWSGTVAGSFSRAYDSKFRRQSDTVPCAGTSVACSAITYGYDADDLLTSAGPLTVSRDAATGFVSSTTAGGLADNFAYNSFGELTHYALTYNATTMYSLDLTRDDGGRVSNKTEFAWGDSGSTSLTFGYDAAGRLTDVTQGTTNLAHYGYDSNSNRTSRTTPSASESGTYNDQDQALTYNGATYTYTPAGELLTKTDASGTTTYTYDELGNLIHVALANGTAVDYVIDGQNRRIGKKISGTLVKGWLYGDQLRPIAELDGSNNVRLRFVYATRSNVPDLIIQGDTVYRVVADQVGSVRLVIAVNGGAVAQRIDYDEFGRVTNDTSPGFQPFGFAGGVYDPDTALTRFGARDYDAVSGRWTVKDSIRFAGGDTNLYGYAFTDPINFVDRTGLITVPFVGNVPAGEEAGATAVDSYAGTLTDPNAEWYEQAGAAIGGAFAALWTPETSDATATVLGCAIGESAIVRGVQRGGWLNANRYLRIGFGKGPGAQRVFRIAGDIVKWIVENGHIDLWKGPPF